MLLRGHLHDRQRRVEAFQPQTPQATEGESGGLPGQDRDKLTGQDLALPGPVAEPAGHHDGRPEKVPRLLERLAGMDPDPEAEGGLRMRALLGGNRGLHGDAAAESVEGARERHHQAIAQALDLPATGGSHGPAEQVEVPAEDPPSGVVAQPVEDCGRAHQIGEHHRHHPARGRSIPGGRSRLWVL